MARHGDINPQKLLKEEFVSGLTGSSMLEISALSTIVPAVAVLRQWSGFCNGTCKCASRPKKKDDGDMADSGRSWRRYIASLTVDYIFVILPILSTLTVLADWVYMCTIALMFLLLWILAKRSGPYTIGHMESSNTSPLRTSILSYRVSMMIVTCLCILAVDFKIFLDVMQRLRPMMDLGVGSFVLANALVSKQARCSTMGKWNTTLKSITPLIVLGFGRLIFTKGVDYQVHVGEYGVHWNFFFTLAAVSLLTSITRLHPIYCGILGLSILVAYQILLMSGLNIYLLSDERASDIISLNKEGIFSVFGYWGMYLVGVYLGHSLLFGNVATGMTKEVQQTRTKVWFLCVMFWLLTVILDKHVERVSRRMCNLAYVTLVLAQNFQVFSIMLVSDLVPGQKPLLLEEAIDQNLLGVFLLANLLTGMVNLCVDTLSSSTVAAFGILSGYSVVLVGFVGLARFCRVKLKFW
ncbi:unnamed protein product [Spirodela intermedia]|uniref:Uncharacterized protein n=1 Tax=Spirodela intermedia TaxID=51605 RepID=A0A7I8J1P5_SPIIN|nr:unnamed protein product [Spirodela intermedia]CAA6664057.1 unnamed protein product [Spirodela intermedia]